MHNGRMSLYRLTRKPHNGPLYAVNNGFVIAAPTTEQARRLANHYAADEGNIWEDLDLTRCDRIGESVLEEGYWPPQIILTDYNAG